MPAENKILLCIVGPTASGKTKLAVRLADIVEGEIISADSRQVYRGMDIGTGKDKNEYIIHNKLIPSHLIDIVEPGYHYNVYEYQRDFQKVYIDINERNHQPILCGGSGMYIESVLRNYRLDEVPEDKVLRAKMMNMSNSQLIEMLASYTKLHNHSDTCDRNRLLRAIEIQVYNADNPKKSECHYYNYLIFYLHFERDILRQRITDRLNFRLKNGMIDEVKMLLETGLLPEEIMYYGLEYKYITLYLLNKLTYDEMHRQLNIAIHQFAKRQCTWFRGMQRKGLNFHTIQGILPEEENLDYMLKSIETIKSF